MFSSGRWTQWESVDVPFCDDCESVGGGSTVRIAELNFTNQSKLKMIRDKFPVKDWMTYGYCDTEFLQTINWHWLTFVAPSEKIHTVLAIIYGIIMVIGMSGNLLVVSMFCRCRTLRTPANYLILNLATSDFFILAEIPAFIFNCINKGPAIGFVGCQVYGFVGGVMGTASIMTLTMISIDRYYVIVHPLNPFKKTTYRRAIVMIIFVWLYSMLFATVPLILLNGYVPEGLLTSCSFDYLAQDLMSRLFVFVYFIAAWLLPLTLIIYSYAAIFRMVQQAEKFNEFHNDGSSRKIYKSSGRNDELSKELKIALITTGIILLWLLAWTPYALVSLFGIFGQKHLITPLVSSLPALFCKTASCIDPFVYSVSHPRFKRELLKFKMWSRLCRQSRGTAALQHDTLTSHFVSATCVDNSDTADLTQTQAQIELPMAYLKPNSSQQSLTQCQSEDCLNHISSSPTQKPPAALSPRYSNSMRGMSTRSNSGNCEKYIYNNGDDDGGGGDGKMREQKSQSKANVQKDKKIVRISTEVY